MAEHRMRDVGHCITCGTTYLPPGDLTYPGAGVEASLVECAHCKTPTRIGTSMVEQRRAAGRQAVVRRPRSSRERSAGWPAALRAGRRVGDGQPPA